MSLQCVQSSVSVHVVPISFVPPWYPFSFVEVARAVHEREDILLRSRKTRTTAGILDLPLAVLSAVFEPLIAEGGHDARIVLQRTCKTFRLVVTFSIALWTDLASYPWAPTKFKLALAPILEHVHPLSLTLDEENESQYPSTREDRIPAQDLMLGFIAHCHSITIRHYVTVTKLLIELNRAGSLNRLLHLVLAPANALDSPPLRIYPIQAPVLDSLVLHGAIATFPVSTALTSLVICMRSGFTTNQPDNWGGAVSEMWALRSLFDLFRQTAASLRRLALIDVFVPHHGALPQVHFPRLRHLELVHSMASMVSSYLSAFSQPSSCYVVVRVGYSSPHIRFSDALIHELRILLDTRNLPFVTVGTFWNHSYLHFNPHPRAVISPRPRPSQIATRDELSPVVFQPSPGSVDVSVFWPTDFESQGPIQWGELLDALSAPRRLSTPITNLEIAHEFGLGRPGHPLTLYDVETLSFRPYDPMECFAFTICDMVGSKNRKYTIYDLLAVLYLSFPSVRTVVDLSTQTVVSSPDSLSLAYSMWKMFYRSPDDML